MKEDVELIDSFKNRAASLLGLPAINLDLKYYDTKTQKFELVNDFYYIKVQTGDKFLLGDFRLCNKGSHMGGFRLYEMPHCCGIMLSCGSWVEKEYTGKGLGKELNKLRQEIGKKYGYSLILCTDLETNTAQRRILKSNEWVDIYQFKNKRTTNVLNITVKEI